MSEEERALRGALREVLADLFPEPALRAAQESVDGAAPKLERALAEVGVTGLGIPERFGGSGGDPALLTAVFEELGAALVAGPYLPTLALAVPALLAADDDGAAPYLTAVATGSMTATVAHAGAFTADVDGPDALVSGCCARALEAARADVVVVVADTTEGPSAFAVDTSAPGVRRTQQTTMDSGRRLADITLDGARATRLGTPGRGPEILDAARDAGCLALAAECVGGAARLVDVTAAYAKERRQFGRVIGSFQAVKHACADMVLDLERARSALLQAVQTLQDEQQPRTARAAHVSMAKAVCSEAYLRVARAAIQVHGGIGFTWEHPAHLHLKRAAGSTLLLGSAREHRTRFGTTAPPRPLVPTTREAGQDDAVARDLVSRARRLISDGPDPRTADGMPFRGAQFDAGLAWVHLPPGCGGLGIDARYQPVVDAVLGAAGVVPAHLRNPIGYGNVAPVLAVHGTDQQRRDYLRRCFTVEDVWCQLMSEPGAGSDVAGLATRAVRDGDGWCVTGQKVWTSLAHIARWGLLVARTDPDVSKHQGITCFIVDMRAPGIEVRPLRMLTGKADFNEVFLTDVRIPDANRVGPVGGGWPVVRSNLEGERLAFGRDSGETFAWDDLLERWRGAADPDPALSDRVLAAVMAGRAARIAAARADTGEPVHPAAVKVLTSEATQECLALALALEGEAALLYPHDGYAFEQPDRVGVMQGGPGTRWLRSQALTIEGGTSMVMRNAIGEGVLGLPRERREDVGIAWRDIPRS